MVNIWKIKLAGIIVTLAVLAVSAGAVAAPHASIKQGHGALGAGQYSFDVGWDTVPPNSWLEGRF